MATASSLTVDTSIKLCHFIPENKRVTERFRTALLAWHLLRAMTAIL
jgi:hypothetical protein